MASEDLSRRTSKWPTHTHTAPWPVRAAAQFDHCDDLLQQLLEKLFRVRTRAPSASDTPRFELEEQGLHSPGDASPRVALWDKAGMRSCGQGRERDMAGMKTRGDEGPQRVQQGEAGEEGWHSADGVDDEPRQGLEGRGAKQWARGRAGLEEHKAERRLD